jgi:8-oxo-dGTP pyrophosphatase MutT (NUDIX family)
MEIARRPMLVVSGLACASMLWEMPSRILMGKRLSASKRPGLWETPGGKVEEYETPQDALIREWQEELDLQVTVGDWIATTPIFDLEVRFYVELYHVEIIDTGALWKKLDHEEVTWVDPAHAVERLGCSPAFYSHYPEIREWLRRRRDAATS